MPVRSEDEVLNRVRSLLLLKAATSKGQIGSASRSQTNVAAKWKELFQQYNRDGSGALSFNDLRALVRHSLHLGEKSCPDAELRLLFTRIDADSSTKIEFDEFYEYLRSRSSSEALQSEKALHKIRRAVHVALRRQKIRTEAHLTKLFQTIEVESEACPPFEMILFLRSELGLTKHEASDRDIQRCFKGLDKNGNGSLEVGELFDFVKIAMNKVSDFGSSASAPVLPAIVTEETQAKHAAAAVATASSELTAATGGTKSPAAAQRQNMLLAGGELPRPGYGRNAYLVMRGADTLSRIEHRLFDSGMDVRGHFFTRRARGDQASTAVGPPTRDRLKALTSKDLRGACCG